jgi:hypothetical protein
MLDVRTAVLKIMAASEYGCILFTSSRTVYPFTVKEFKHILCQCKTATTHFCNSILTFPVRSKNGSQVFAKK